MRQKRGVRLVIFLALLLILTVVAGCGQQATESTPEPAGDTKDKIVIGQAISLSGPLAPGVAMTSGPVYDLWVEQVNKDGGIYVEEYGKKLPIEYVKYDDKSDMGTMTKLLDKLMLEDKVDFVLPPWSTAFLYAACPIVDKNGYILIGGPGGAEKLKELMPDLPNVFQVLNFAETQMPALAEVLKELGIKTAAVVHLEDLHGIEYKDGGVPALEDAGIEVKMVKSFPMGTKDLSPLLKEAKALGVDAFIGFSYPEDTMLLTQQAIELDCNFKVLYFTVGPYAPTYRDAFGTEVVEGVMGAGAWNAKSSPGAQEFVDLYQQTFNKEPDDYWGQLYYYASLQHFQQAIEEAGTLDQAKIREIMATKTYDTFVGPFKYDEDRFFRGHLGEIGQWQNGVFEVIDPDKNRTAPPILKPQWPKKS